MYAQPRPNYAPPLVAVSESGERGRQRRPHWLDAAAGLSLGLSTPRLPQHSHALQNSAVASAVFHVLLLTTLVLVVGRSNVTSRFLSSAAAAAEPAAVSRMVFLLTPGPGGGGGGGGNRRPGPLPRAQGIGRNRVMLPVASPLVASREPADVERPAQQVVLDAVPLASGTAFQAGLPDGLQTIGSSQGPGFGGGVGEGIGTGIGSGTGPGIGPGSGGGFGGGVYRPGGGIVPPTLLKQVVPKYTDGALERRIQGTVVLEVVVMRDGIPGAIRVSRSLDPGGLDEQAVDAVREWRFNPGRLGTTPVDVLVTILLDFRIH